MHVDKEQISFADGTSRIGCCRAFKPRRCRLIVALPDHVHGGDVDGELSVLLNTLQRVLYVPDGDGHRPRIRTRDASPGYREEIGLTINVGSYENRRSGIQKLLRSHLGFPRNRFD